MSKKTKSLSIHTLLLGFVLPLVAIFGYVYYESKQDHSSSPQRVGGIPAMAKEDLAGGLFSYLNEDVTTATTTSETEPWESIYPGTLPMQIGPVTVRASVAKSWPDRIKGLSGTPYLPEEVVKLFVFDSSALHGIWMKDMNYAIDIIWVDEADTIVHIVKRATPESFPETFSPTVPALYVIETAAGFVDENDISLGAKVIRPTL